MQSNNINDSNICACCGRMFTVANASGSWFCFYCDDEENKTSWKCAKVHRNVAKKTYFISGPLELTDEEFKDHYLSSIDGAIKDPNSFFVLGDACGSDLKCNQYLAACIELFPEYKLFDRVIVYHMKEKARNNLGKFQTVGGFSSDCERDTAMTDMSTHDILWIRTEEESRKKYGDKYDPNFLTGTQKNQLRRMLNLFFILDQTKIGKLTIKDVL